MSWLFSNVAGGAVRWATATLIAAVCIVLGFSPSQWFAAIITEPPPWLISPVTRVLIILVGAIACFLVVAWDRLFANSRDKDRTQAFTTLDALTSAIESLKEAGLIAMN
jgi:hypothetical protein